MRSFIKFLPLLSIILFFVWASPQVFAQGVTSAEMDGKITDQKGEPLEGATVVAVHVPTGTKYGAYTRAGGLFNIANMRSGGPYKVSISYVGYKTTELDNIVLSLGNTFTLNEKVVEESATLQTVTIEVDRNDQFSDSRMGMSTAVGKDRIASLPTLSRSLQDMTRLTPNASGANSFGGTNFRYNNITIDGAVNNDAFGFSPSSGVASGSLATGTPGGQTRTQPISLDAISEVAVQQSPYDVKLGNFTGGSVNAVTRSGTNEVEGSVYYFYRDGNITGNSIDGRNTSLGNSYYEHQVGFRLGAPIIKDKFFFFINAELSRRLEPVLSQPGDPSSNIDGPTADAIAAKLRNTYGYDVGAYGTYGNRVNANKLFVRLDYNINENHQLTLRHNVNSAFSDNLERAQSLLRFGSQDYQHNAINNSSVLELKSRFGNTISNNLLLGYNNIQDFRAPNGTSQQYFPQLEITNGQNLIFLGTEREAAPYKVNTQVFEFTDHFSWYLGKHNVTLGTHNEFNSFQYYFLNSYVGRVAYPSIARFLDDNPNRVRANFVLTNNGNTFDPTLNTPDNAAATPSAQFNVYMLSVYGQDEWKATDKLKVSYGLRFDWALVPNSLPQWAPYFNAANNNLTNGSSPVASQPLGQVNISPRVGFNYDVFGDKKLQIRGGSGLFTGRMPFAWLAYAYYLNGNNYGNVDVNNIAARTATNDTRVFLNNAPGTGNPVNVALIPQITVPTLNGGRPFWQANAAGVPLRELDLPAQNLRLPQTWRSSLAIDAKLPLGITGSIEGMFSKNVYDIYFSNLNSPSGLQAPVGFLANTGDNRPFFSGGRADANFTQVLYMANTSQGYRYNITGMLSKQFDWGLYAQASYTYGRAYDIANGQRNSWQSNWEVNQVVVPNTPTLTLSNYNLTHRFLVVLSYKAAYGSNKQFATGATLIYSGQSGNPYTYTINGDPTGAGAPTMLLPYIPNNRQDIFLTDLTLGSATAAPTSFTLGAGDVVPGFTIGQTVQQGTALPSGTVLSANTQYAFLDAFISNDAYLKNKRGQYADRNGAETPWNHQLDLRLSQDIGFKIGNKSHTIQLTWDIINFSNLINNTWGRVYFVPNLNNQQVNLLNFSSRTAATGTPTVLVNGVQTAVGNNTPVYTYTPIVGDPWAVDQLLSRWQMQFGVRYSF